MQKRTSQCGLAEIDSVPVGKVLHAPQTGRTRAACQNPSCLYQPGKFHTCHGVLGDPAKTKNSVRLESYPLRLMFCVDYGSLTVMGVLRPAFWHREGPRMRELDGWMDGLHTAVFRSDPDL